MNAPSDEQNPDVVLWQGSLLRGYVQALEDLARASSAEVLFLRHPSPQLDWELIDTLQATAAQQGFVTARVGVLSERCFDAFDTLVRSIGRSVMVPGADKGQRGIASVLQGFASRFAGPEAALLSFEDGIEREAAAGDLVELSRAYLSVKRPVREASKIEAWLSGTESSRAENEATVLSALSPRTAKRALAEISKLIRALGHRGMVVFFTGADVIARMPESRREDAYTVLRELVDNADGGRGLSATQLVIAGGSPLFVGPRSILSLPPLATRVTPPPDAPAGLPPPHRPCIDVVPPGPFAPLPAPLIVRPAPEHALAALRVVVRAAQGVPPTEPVVELSVGHERIDATISALFELAAINGSVFGLLTGSYGSGKTHLLMHLSARALADRRPVFRLSLERLDSDLGNPQRHLRRLLEQAILPLPGSPGPLDRLVAWTRSRPQLDRLVAVLGEIASEDSDAALAARKVTATARKVRRWGAALEGYLGALDLVPRPSSPTYRQDAYNRLLLWLTLLERLDGCAGPVVVIDEAESLYQGGKSRAERRTALRSLSFYCGGALPGACVVMAVTPDALVKLREEASELLQDVAAQRTVLPWEDASMLQFRLTTLRPIEAPTLTLEQRAVLSERVRLVHQRARGMVDDPGWGAYVHGLLSQQTSPRELVRRVIDRLERRWWLGSAGG